MAELPLTGGCLCGAVRYEVEGPATEVTHCHCPMCRKQHGAAFATYAGYGRDRLRLTAGEEALRVYRSSPRVERRCCGRCGASLFWVDLDGERIWVAAGTLDGDPGRPPGGHIFVGSRAPWHTITDDLPQHEEFAQHP